MENQMPAMPGVEENNLPLPGEVESPPVIEPKQEIINPDKDSSSDVDIPLVPKEGIKVVATRKGFYGQMRISEGQEFVVGKFESLGKWMKCLDSNLEKQRAKKFNKKKAKK